METATAKKGAIGAVLFVGSLGAGLLGGVALMTLVAAVCVWILDAWGWLLSSGLALTFLVSAVLLAVQLGGYIRWALLGLSAGVILQLALAQIGASMGAVATGGNEICLSAMCSFPFVIGAIVVVLVTTTGAMMRAREGPSSEGRAIGRRRRIR